IEEEETESHEHLPCISLFGDLYIKYATSITSDYSSGERSEMVGKRLFPEKFSQYTSFSRKKLNKDQIYELNTMLCNECINLEKSSRYTKI
ncbi:20577_t:CDS:2, partial [Funneliformis geosporum]